jgi:hypothetical protein
MNSHKGSRRGGRSSIPAILLLLAVVSCPLRAQQYVAFSSEMDDIRTSASWKLGPFNIFNRFILNYGHDNNLYGSEPPKKPVTANFISAGLPIRTVLVFRDWLIFEVAASPRYEYFFDIPTERALNISFSPRVKTLLFHRIVASGSWRHGRSRYRASREIDRRVWVSTEGYWLDLFYDTPRQTSIGLSAYSTRFKLEAVTLAGSSVPLSTALNRREKNATLEFYYMLSQGTFFFTNFGITEYRFSSVSSSFRDSNSYQSNLGIRFPLIGKSMGTISLGYRKLVPVNRQAKSFSGLVGNTSADFRLGRFSLRAGFIRDTPFSYSAGVIYFIDQNIQAGASFYLSQRFRLDYDFGYGDARYPLGPVAPSGGGTTTAAAERHDLYRSHTVGLVVRIVKRMGIRFDANYWDRDSNFFLRGITRTTFGASLTYQF